MKERRTFRDLHARDYPNNPINCAARRCWIHRSLMLQVLLLIFLWLHDLSISTSCTHTPLCVSHSNERKCVFSFCLKSFNCWSSSVRGPYSPPCKKGRGEVNWESFLTEGISSRQVPWITQRVLEMVIRIFIMSTRTSHTSDLSLCTWFTVTKQKE